MNIAFIGLGTMGAPMARNILKGGFPLAVYNRTPEKAESLVAQGASQAATPAEAAEHADVVITCLSDTPDVEAVMLGDNGISQGARPDTIVVDMSTISPSATRRLAETLGAQGIKLVDAPVSGGSEGAVNGTLSIMVGGDAADVQKIHPVMECMGSRIVHIGPVGSGQTVKAINQIIVAGTYWSVAEGVTLGLKAGLDMEKVVEAVAGGAAGSWGLSNRSTNMIENRYPLGFRVKLHRKDLNIALELARELGVALPMAAYVEQVETGLIGRGHGDEDVSVMARSLREQAGLESADDLGEMVSTREKESPDTS